jgi:hypothetical protein
VRLGSDLDAHMKVGQIANEWVLGIEGSTTEARDAQPPA